MSGSGLEQVISWGAGVVTPGGGGGGGAGVGGAWGWVALGLVAVGVGILVAFGAAMRRKVTGAGGEDPAGFASGEVLADVDELSRRLAEELDEKAARLERLLAEADARIERLEAAARRAGAAAPNGHAAAREGGADPVNAQVYEMADRGCSAVEIAQSLGQHVGKVELILALRR